MKINNSITLAQYRLPFAEIAHRAEALQVPVIVGSTV
jgi:hypothetical protein